MKVNIRFIKENILLIQISKRSSHVTQLFISNIETVDIYFQQWDIVSKLCLF